MGVAKKRITANFTRSAKALGPANQKRFTDSSGQCWRVDVGHGWFPVDYPDGFVEVLLDRLDPQQVDVEAVPAVDDDAAKLLSTLPFVPCDWSNK